MDNKIVMVVSLECWDSDFDFLLYNFMYCSNFSQ